MFFAKVKAYTNQIRYMQYVATFAATLAAASLGMHAVWPSPSLPKLTSVYSPIGYRISDEEASWIVSCPALGAIITAFVKIFVSDMLGRKTWLLICGVLVIMPGVVIYFSKTVILICVARFLLGMASGITYTTAPVYIAEIAEKDIRGKLAIYLGLLSLCGNVFVLTVGPFLSYHNLALCCFVVPVIFVAIFCFMPESPYYLIKNGLKAEALNSLSKVLIKNTSNDVYVNIRLKEIEDSVIYDMQNKSTVREILRNKYHRKVIVIILGAKGLLLLCGTHVIEGYAQTIIEKTESSISPEMSSLLFGVIQVPTVIIASFLVDNIGRKPLWIVSAIGCATALFGGGLYFYLGHPHCLAWLPTASLIVYFVMCPIGVTTLPFVIVGEIFSNNIKSAAVSASVVYGSILSFAALKSYEPLATRYGIHVVFWMFAGFCALGAFFIYFVVPETKGKSLEEIQEILNRTKKIKHKYNTT